MLTRDKGLRLRPVANSDAVIGGHDDLKYRFTVLTDGLIRYEYAEDGKFEDRASTFAICRDLPVPKFRVLDKGDDGIEVVTDRFRLLYDKKPFSANGLTAHVVGNLTDWKSVWKYGVQCYDLGGTARTLDDAGGRIPLDPGIVSRNGFAVLDDSETMLFTEDNWVAPRSAGQRIDGYLFAYGHDYREALQAFYAVSGSPPLLPRWALGNWWSRYYAYSADDYLALMDKFRDEQIPFSVGVMDMDWHPVDIDPKHGSGWTGYSWNKDLFPDPAAFLKALHDRGLKVTLNVHPADGIRSYEDAYEDMAKELNHPTENEDPITFDVTNRQFMEAYFKILHHRLEKDGVDFWWLDWQQGALSKLPGIDPLWMLNHFHFIDNAKGGTRPLTFSRYAGPGSHRYPVGFSGDTYVTWESLDFQAEFTAKASNIGYGWWSHDIGGHTWGYKNDELATRWVQLGVYSPILRLHSSNNPFVLKTPWSFGLEACEAQKMALRFRHRLTPYLYTMNYISARDGIPLVLPMYYDHPDEDGAYKFPNQFLFGSQLIVMPITSPVSAVTRLASADIWLPKGQFVDLFSSVVYDGGRITTLYRPLSSYPVLLKAGSIVPLNADMHPGHGTERPDCLEIVCVVGADGHFELVEDDGTGSGIDDQKPVLTTIHFEQKSGTLTIESHDPESRDIKIRLPAFVMKHDFKFSANDGEPIAFERIYNSGRDTIVVLPRLPGKCKAKIELGENPQLTPTDVHEGLEPILQGAQIEYGQKYIISGVITTEGPKTVKISRIMGIAMDEALRGALLEIMLADERSVI